MLPEEPEEPEEPDDAVWAFICRLVAAQAGRGLQSATVLQKMTESIHQENSKPALKALLSGSRDTDPNPEHQPTLHNARRQGSSLQSAQKASPAVDSRISVPQLEPQMPTNTEIRKMVRQEYRRSNTDTVAMAAKRREERDRDLQQPRSDDEKATWKNATIDSESYEGRLKDAATAKDGSDDSNSPTSGRPSRASTMYTPASSEGLISPSLLLSTWLGAGDNNKPTLRNPVSRPAGALPRTQVPRNIYRHVPVAGGEAVFGWGELFCDKGFATTRCAEVFRGLAKCLAEQFKPRTGSVITPEKLGILYSRFRLDREEYQFGNIFYILPRRGQNNTSSEAKKDHLAPYYKAIGYFFSDLECEYYLIPEPVSGTSVALSLQPSRPGVPCVPALTPYGFARFYTICVLANPEEEAQRMHMMARSLPPFTNKNNLPTRFPRNLFPARPDTNSRKLLTSAVEDLLYDLDPLLRMSSDSFSLSPGLRCPPAVQSYQLADYASSSVYSDSSSKGQEQEQEQEQGRWTPDRQESNVGLGISGMATSPGKEDGKVTRKMRDAHGHISQMKDRAPRPYGPTRLNTDNGGVSTVNTKLGDIAAWMEKDRAHARERDMIRERERDRRPALHPRRWTDRTPSSRAGEDRRPTWSEVIMEQQQQQKQKLEEEKNNKYRDTGRRGSRPG
ncbi:hypothetical protein GGS20DRAFT_583486 [Poronia punctata]|nr:hypothetical protein GGS20DRAFT_583486 [Poronia punctata]